jgi:hypothetical protein
MELVKLNVDGCSKGNPGFAGAGGVLRDSLGSWIKGFAINTVFAFQLKWSCGHRSQDWNLLDHCVYVRLFFLYIYIYIYIYPFYSQILTWQLNGDLGMLSVTQAVKTKKS